MINPDLLEAEAKKVYSEAVYLFVTQGSGKQWTLRENQYAWSDWAFNPHRMGGVVRDKIDTSVTLLGEKLPHPITDAGIYAHQVRVSPSDRTVVLVTRGNDATSSKREDPGALKVFDFKNGQLSNEKSIAPGNGFGFGPRHVDFHPTMPWMYVSMERENQLQVFGLQNGRLTAAPLFIKTTLSEPSNVRPAQVVGPVHVSRDGKFVYLANRSDGTVDFEGKKVYAGGENSIAVFRIDEQSGEPTLFQNIPTQNFHVRTFTLHPNGKMLVAARVAPMLVHEGDGVNKVSASLSVFRVEDNGMLTFVRKSDIDTTAGPMFWC